MDTLRLCCKCGALLRQTDEKWRLDEAAEEFRRVHNREFCAVSFGTEAGAVTRQAERQRSHRAKGLCRSCPRPAEGGRCFCEYHRERNREHCRKQADGRRKTGRRNRCSACNESGHNMRSCPRRGQS